MSAPLLEIYPRFYSADGEATQACLDIVGFEIRPAKGDDTRLGYAGSTASTARHVYRLYAGW